jgi:hypothetical protein
MSEEYMNQAGKAFVLKNYFHAIFWAFILFTAMLLVGCGGGHEPSKQQGMYAAGSKTEKDLEELLKADARVDSYDLQGDKLTVNIKPTLAEAPIGLQQRAVWNWYNTLQAARNGSKNVSVEALAEGTKVASWTAGDGFKVPAQAKKEGEEKSE